MKRFMMTTAIVAVTAMPASVMAASDESAQQDEAMKDATATFRAESPAGDTMNMKASNLIGHRIYIAEPGADMSNMGEVSEAPDSWQMAGEIDDVVISKDGSVQEVLIDAGGFLGMGENNLRVSLETIRFQPDADEEGEYFAIYTGDRNMLGESERYDEAAASEQGETLGTNNWDGYTDDADANMQTVSYDQFNTEELLGTTVYGSNDEWVGEISELELGDDGKVSGLILDIGGFLGLGEHAVSMPMDKVELRRMGDDGEVNAYVSATEEELENMKAYDAS